jgi:hypothetical protein
METPQRGYMEVTSVQVTRETSKLLDEAVKVSGLRKGFLADAAIKFFLDPDKNPDITKALQDMRDTKEKVQIDFLERVFNSPRTEQHG